MLLRVFIAAAIALGAAAGCHPQKAPQLSVIEAKPEVVFVQVTNPANSPMKLTHLAYSFAADTGATVSRGELDLSRDVPAGAAVVVEVPLDAQPAGAMTLTGTLTAQLDQIVQSFQLHAKIQPR